MEPTKKVGLTRAFVASLLTIGCAGQMAPVGDLVGSAPDARCPVVQIDGVRAQMSPVHLKEVQILVDGGDSAELLLLRPRSQGFSVLSSALEPEAEIRGNYRTEKVEVTAYESSLGLAGVDWTTVAEPRDSGVQEVPPGRYRFVIRHAAPVGGAVVAEEGNTKVCLYISNSFQLTESIYLHTFK